jgi:hypothetical protein
LRHDQVQTLIGAIQTLREEIGSSPLSAMDKADLIEVAEDAEKELNKEQPNKLRLSSLLGGLATGIQTAGSLGPAYHVFKTAAAAVGIQLP